MTQHIKSLVFPIILVFYEVSIYLSNDMYLPALPDMMRDLSLTTKQVQFTLTTWFIGMASMPLILGILSDRYGRRPVLLCGGVVYILATMVCAITTHHHTLLIARFIEGGMASSMMVAGYAAIHELYDHKEAIRILALMGSISVLAPALGPLFGGIVLSLMSWRGIFWIIAIWAMIAILLLMKWMPETLTRTQQKNLNVRALVKSYRTVLMNPQFMLLMCVLGCIFAGFITWITAGPLLIIENFHYSAISFGIFQAIVFMAYIIGNSMVRTLLDKMSIHHLIQLGMSIALGGGVLMLIFALLFSHYLYGFMSGMVIFSFGTALSFPPLNRMIIEASHEPMGVRVALFTVFLTGFAVLGSAMSGLFFNGTILSLTCLVIAFIVISCGIKLGLNLIKY